MELLRFGWKEDEVERDWPMRLADRWDIDLPSHVSKENQTLQALKDALSLRGTMEVPHVLSLLDSDGIHSLSSVCELGMGRRMARADRH